MKIEYLERFLEVARCQSISKASRNLFLDQSTLSTSIEALERELHVDLFKRRKQGMQLTDAGQALVPVVENMIKEYNEILNISSERSYTNRQITIAYSPMHESVMIKSFLPKIKQDYQEIQINLKETYAGEVRNKIQKNDALIGISGASRFGLERTKEFANRNDLGFKQLDYCDEGRICVRYDHPLANRESVCLEELSNYSFALHEGRLPPYAHTGSVSLYKNFRDITCFSNPHCLIHAIVYNNMVANLSTTLIKESVYYQKGIIKDLRLENNNNELISYLIYNKDCLRNELGARAIQILTEICSTPKI